MADGLPAGLDGMRSGGDGDAYPLTTQKIPGYANLLRGAGNAIVPAVAVLFIRAFLAAEKEGREA